MYPIHLFKFSSNGHKKWTIFSILITSLFALPFLQAEVVSQSIIQIDNKKQEVLNNNEELRSDYVQDESAIRSLITQYAKARSNRDSSALGTILAKDADQLVSSGNWRKGKSALIEGMQGSSTRNPGNRILEVESVRFISSEVAIADARYTIRSENDRPDRKMWSTFIVVRKKSKWVISAIRNMLPATQS